MRRLVAAFPLSFAVRDPKRRQVAAFQEFQATFLGSGTFLTLLIHTVALARCQHLANEYRKPFKRFSVAGYRDYAGLKRRRE